MSKIDTPQLFPGLSLWRMEVVIETLYSLPCDSEGECHLPSGESHHFLNMILFEMTYSISFNSIWAHTFKIYLVNLDIAETQ